MFELDQGIADQLTEVSLNSSVQVRRGNSNSFMATASTLIPLLQMFEMKVKVYGIMIHTPNNNKFHVIIFSATDKKFHCVKGMQLFCIHVSLTVPL